jgi:xylulokinase
MGCGGFNPSTVVSQLPDPVRLISLTAQGWLLAGGCRRAPYRPRHSLNDARGAAIVDRWREDGILPKPFAEKGSQAFAGLPNAVFTWLRRHVLIGWSVLTSRSVAMAGFSTI